MMVISGAVMPGNIRPLGYNSHWHRDSGRMIVLVPLPDTAYNRHRKNADGQYEHNYEHNLKHSEAHVKAWAKSTSKPHIQHLFV